MSLLSRTDGGGGGAPLYNKKFNGCLPVNNGHVELVEDQLCKQSTPPESDPGRGITTALIRAGGKLHGVFVCMYQGRGEHSECFTRNNMLF